MTKANFKNSVIALAIGLSMISCGGGGNKQQQSATTETETAVNSSNTGGVYTIPTDKINVLSNALEVGGSKEAVIAEIPAELFKAIGKKLSYCQITKCYDENYKYTLAINTFNDDGKAEVAKLVEYYKSIGATVETVGNGYYKVAFDYAQSVRVSATSGAVEVQFSVVKK